MTLITIRQQQTTESGFTATVSFDRQGDYAIAITSLLNDPEEAELGWYFEEWIRYPFAEKVRKNQAEQTLKRYGQELFQQVFKANFDIYGEYRNLRERLSQVQIEIESTSPEFQSLHWEAMQDPNLPLPLAVSCVMLRKSVKPAPSRARVNPSPVVNLLVVTARPDEENDVGYRTISRPLVEAIENSRLRVNIELLRPGTYEALSRHLDGREGHYHIIHFDAHGAVLSYENLRKQQERQADRYRFQARYGREDIQPYEGLKGFLLLEGDRPGEADLVEAGELAALLTGKGIPVCILNACQSGKQVNRAEDGHGNGSENGSEGGSEDSAADNRSPLSADQRETSLGSRLMNAGMQMVVAMGYSVTVSAASLLMEKIYRELFADRGMTNAIRLGRKELYERKSRRVYFNQEVDLEDWILPVVYVNQAVDLKLCEFADPHAEEAYFEQQGRRYRFPQPTYGFVGRDLEILKLEKRLLKHNVLLLRGMGGTGKTTLLNYLREWWQTTRFVQETFYFGYDDRAWTLEQIVFEIGQRLFDRFDRFHSMNLEARKQKLIAKLRSEKYGLILDNLESVTGQALSIPNTLPEAEQRSLADFIYQLSAGGTGGETKVLLGSRSGEEWLQASFRDNVYALKGLDPESRSVFAEAILARQIKDPKLIRELRQDEDFKRLMKLLAGYPLAMEVVLANLKQQTPKQILEALQAADVQLNVGGADRTNNILKCVEYSHSNLSPSAQELLVCLAPFSSFIDREAVKLYAHQLQQLEPFQDVPFDQFDAAIEEAIRWGLLEPIHEEMPRLLQIQPVFPFFLCTKLSQWEPEQREALNQGFRQHYRALAWQCQQVMDSKEAKKRQFGIFSCRLEYENLYHALELCLQQQERIEIFFCLHQYFRVIQDSQSEFKLAIRVNQKLEQYALEKLEQLGEQVIGAVDLLAYSYLKTQQYQSSRQTYEKELEVLQKLSNLEERQRQLGRARTYHQLGIVTQELREYEQARNHYQQALQIFIEYNDRYKQADTYHQLGSVAQELREYEQARNYLKQALQIYVEYSDRYAQATTYHSLGLVAQNSGEYEQSRDYYQQALQIKIEYNDRYEQANTYHNLGIVAQELGEYEQARDYLQQALQIKVDYNDRYEQAYTHGQLGIVAQHLRQYEQARDYYQQALQVFIEYNDRYEQAKAHHTLGRVAQELGEYEQARDYYQQALQIFIECDDRYSQAGTYYWLGDLTEAMEDWESAKQHYLENLRLAIEVGYEAGLETSLQNLARFYRAVPDDEWLQQVAILLQTTVDELKQAIQAAAADQSSSGEESIGG